MAHPPRRASLLVAVVAAVAAAGALAHGSSPFANATGVSWRPSPAGQYTCGPIRLAPAPALDAADWRQCAALYSQWVAENGTFGVANADARPAYLPLLRQTDCALAVAPLALTAGPFLVGSRDIEAMLQRSLNEYSSGTLLAVHGTVECDVATGGRAPLSWRIFRLAGSR